MLKLLQEMKEMRGTVETSNRRPLPRPPALMAVPIRLSRGAPPKQKRVISILMRDLMDIPSPVKIRHLAVAPRPVERA